MQDILTTLRGLVGAFIIISRAEAEDGVHQAAWGRLRRFHFEEGYAFAVFDDGITWRCHPDDTVELRLDRSRGDAHD